MAWGQALTFSEDDFPDVSAMTDPFVDVHLTSGKTIRLAEISIVEVAKRLHHYGFVYLSDGEGSYAVFFGHGVCALTVPSANDK